MKEIGYAIVIIFACYYIGALIEIPFVIHRMDKNLAKIVKRIEKDKI